MHRLTGFCALLLTLLTICEVRSLSSDTITLQNGNKMPLIGFGTFPLPKSEDTENIIYEAIKVGYRKFDTAFHYNNEESVGAGIKKAIQEDGLKREDFFVTTKIWNTFHSKELVQRQMKLSLVNLDLDYVDMLHMHWPTGYEYPGRSKEHVWFPKFENGTVKPSSWNKDDYIETYKGMELVFNKGQAKSLGVSNFNTKQLDKIMEVSEVKPQAHQIELNTHYKQIRLAEHTQKLGIIVEAYSPIYHDVDKEQVIQDIAKKYNKTPVQIGLRWILERGIAVIAKTSKKERMEENLDIFNFNLTKEEINEIFKLQDKEKKIDFKGTEIHPDYPFKEPEEEVTTTTTTTTTTAAPETSSTAASDDSSKTSTEAGGANSSPSASNSNNQYNGPKTCTLW